MNDARQKAILIDNLITATKDGQAVELSAGVVRDVVIPLLMNLAPVVHCSKCRHCQKSCYAGYYYCKAWDQDINMASINPEEYFCAEGEETSAVQGP